MDYPTQSSNVFSPSQLEGEWAFRSFFHRCHRVAERSPFEQLGVPASEDMRRVLLNVLGAQGAHILRSCVGILRSRLIVTVCYWGFIEIARGRPSALTDEVGHQDSPKTEANQS